MGKKEIDSQITKELEALTAGLQASLRSDSPEANVSVEDVVPEKPPVVGRDPAYVVGAEPVPRYTFDKDDCDYTPAPEPPEVHKARADNLAERVVYRQNWSEDNDARLMSCELFEKDITQFFRLILWTYDPRRTPHDRPFLLWDYQVDYVRKINTAIANGEDLFTDKSRDMGVTWCVLGVFYYRWLMFGENFLIGSRKQDLVDKIGDITSLFERLRYFIRFTPDWLLSMKGFNKSCSSFMKIWKADGAALVGESMNKNFSRQGRYNAVLLDEFAFVEQARAIWQACGDATPGRIPVSTPNGKHNQFGELRHNGLIKVISLHWKLHPHKDDTWYEEQKNRRTDREIAQELDISYIVSAGKPFYGGFMKPLHVIKELPVLNSVLLLGWDYGYHRPALVVSQIDGKGRWRVLRAIMGEDQTIRAFGNQMKDYLGENFPGLKHKSYGDPAGNQQTDKSEKTSVSILKEVGFGIVRSIPSNIKGVSNYRARKEIIDLKLQTLVDGLPTLIIDDCCDIIIEGFQGGYHYPNPREGMAGVEYPFHDEYYSHCMNAMEMIAVNIFRKNPAEEAATKAALRKSLNTTKMMGGGKGGW